MGKDCKIGLALGSGSARGFAHIGVLNALEENNIPVDYISGSSAGALIGGLYSCGIEPNFIAKLAMQIDKKMWTDFTVPKKGIIKGEKIEEILKILTRGRNIEDLDKKIAIVAADLKDSSEVIFDSGPLYKAIRASISVPGVFEPIYYDEKILVDGGVVDRVPISVVKEMGADIIIAIDVGFSSYQSRHIQIFDIIQRSIDVMSEQILEADKMYSDVIIEPSLSHIESSEFERVEECVEIGYNATIEKMDEIKKVINEYK
jgi:NTE family protein